MSGEPDTQFSLKGSAKGQSNAIFANFSALLTSAADENANLDSSSEVVTVRLGDFETGALKNVSAQEFIDQIIGNDFIIETKGRANESFPLRWKLFKKLLTEQKSKVTLYKPQNQKECDETISLILLQQNT